MGGMAIRSFRDKRLIEVANGRVPKGFPASLAKQTRMLLAYMDHAVSLDDLRQPPGNRLEALVGDRKGQHSIRVNQQFRLCFVWGAEGPQDVEFVDYH